MPFATESIASGSSTASFSAETRYPASNVLSGPFPTGVSLSDPIRYAYNNQVQPRPFEPRLASILATVAWSSVQNPSGKNSESKGGDQTKPKSPEKPIVTNLPELTLVLPSDPVARVACQSIQAQLAREGITIKLRELTADELTSDKADYDLRYAELAVWEPVADARQVFALSGCISELGQSVHRVRAAQFRRRRQLERRPRPARRTARNCRPRIAAHPAVANRKLLRLSHLPPGRRRFTHDAVPKRGAMGLVRTEKRRTRKLYSISSVTPLIRSTLTSSCPTFARSALRLFLANWLSLRHDRHIDRVVVRLAIAASGGWEYQPYRVLAIVALDLPGGLDENLRQVLPAYLLQRADAALTPLWLFDVRMATGAEALLVRRSLSIENIAKPAADLIADHDKLLLLNVEWTNADFRLVAREYDSYVEHWSPPITRRCAQLSTLPERLFALAERASTPLAQFELDPNQVITLTPRGSALPHNPGGPTWAKPGDVFLPILRRTARNGQPLENGVTPVPWTYIEATAAAAKDKPDTLKFTVQSGSRHPFPARKQARTEQLALALRADAAPTVLHLESRKSDAKPLAGFDVFASTADNRCACSGWN